MSESTRRGDGEAVLIVNKSTGEVVRQTTLGEVKRGGGFAKMRGGVEKWIEGKPMTNSMLVYRFADGFDPEEEWGWQAENHPVLVYDLVTKRAVVAPCTGAACSYLNVSEMTMNQALRGGQAVSGRFVCIPQRCMGQFNGVGKRQLREIAVDHLYSKPRKR